MAARIHLRGCIIHEPALKGMEVDSQREPPVSYKGIHLPCAHRVDLIVEDKLIEELKAVERLEPIHTARVLS